MPRLRGGIGEVENVRKCASDSLFVRIIPYRNWYEKKYSRKLAKLKHNVCQCFVKEFNSYFTYILFYSRLVFVH